MLTGRITRRLCASLLACAATSLTACTGMRFVVDTVPAVDELTETVVVTDAGASSGNKIAQIDVTGLIIDADTPGLLGPGENPTARFVESLQLAANDPSVKGVIIRINSPGGTVTASDVMYREVVRFKRKTGKPVVVSMADVAASGGYYLACSADEIIAMPTTITGSIGVIMQTFNFTEGMKKIGIRADAITSGPNKAVGSPFEPMTPEHRALLQGVVTEFYGNFRGIVISNRTHISSGSVDEITDGRIITGTHALEVGLVDRVGDLHDAFAAAKERAGLTSARLVKYHRPVEYVGSAYASSPATGVNAGAQVNLLQLNLIPGASATPTNFYYLWDPTVW